MVYYFSQLCELTAWFFSQIFLGFLRLDLTADGPGQCWGEWLWLVPGPLHMFCCSSVIYIKCPNTKVELKLLGLNSEVSATFTTFYWAKASHRAIPGTRNGQSTRLVDGGGVQVTGMRNDLQLFFSENLPQRVFNDCWWTPWLGDASGGQQRKIISEVIDEWTR